METNFEKKVRELREKVTKLLKIYTLVGHQADRFTIDLPEHFENDFMGLIDLVSFNLMEEKDNFYGYFLFQMTREIKFEISSGTAMNFKNAKYVIYFNPLIFLNLTQKQMESTIKHEILHIISMHMTRAREIKDKYSKVAMNMAMDIVVNDHLTDLPPYAVTTKWVNAKYGLHLKPFWAFEEYAEQIQMAMDLMAEEAPKKAKEQNLEEAKESDQENQENHENMEEQQSSSDSTIFNVAKTHDLWEESSELDENTLREFTERVTKEAQKGELPTYLQGLIASLKDSRGELPWNLYLNRLMGMVESNKKKTTTRRDRRQPDRLDLRGQLRSHKAKILVAIDISGSISEQEFKKAMLEVLGIVKNYSHDITVVECDDAIERVYKVASEKDLQDRLQTRGATKFSPVFEYANHQNANLLVYFTDGKGEDHLSVAPKGYKVLWVLSGKGEELSLRKPVGVVKKLSRIDIKEENIDAFEVQKGGHSMNNQERI